MCHKNLSRKSIIKNFVSSMSIWTVGSYTVKPRLVKVRPLFLDAPYIESFFMDYVWYVCALGIKQLIQIGAYLFKFMFT